MNARLVKGAGVAALLGVAGLGAAALGAGACSSPRSGDTPNPPVPEVARAPVAREPNYFAGQADVSASTVQRVAHVAVARAFGSRPLRELPDAVPVDEEDRFDHEPGPNPFPFVSHPEPDAVLQSGLPIVEMPVTLQSFLGQGATLGNCVFPRPDAGEPANCTTQGDPPDTVGAVGPNHYVQLVNSGVAVWNKNGTLLVSPKFTSSLFTGMPTTDGNHCGAPPRPSPPGGDWGDGVVLYDQLADRWLITQFDITNDANSNAGPSYQCVAVSQTGDPSGAYWLYDFQYTAAVNDYGKFSVWPDAYYASYNNFSSTKFLSANLCAWDRASMLAGSPATEQCFTNSGFGFLPANVDGSVKPPAGEPAFFVTLQSSTAIGLYKLHVDWKTPANSTFTGPTSLAVAAYNELCGGGNCVVQPSPGNALASLGDRPMFHLAYRNFGTVESLVFNHSVTAGSTGGIRWYEIRSPNGTPVVYQQGTYAPADGNYRWMGSIAQDQAQDIALGYALSGSTTFPSIAWSGRIASDALGTMGQAETVVQAGVGVENGNFKDGSLAQRWGDYSNMTVDPSDDCTFWYTQELYPANGTFNWDTRVSSVTFPSCAKDDFSIALAPTTSNLPAGGKITYTVSTALKKGTGESITLNIQDLPAGVTAAFAPTSVTAGASSTLTLSATLATAATPSADTFTVIGTATSAVHPATAQVAVTPCAKLTACPAPDNCGTIADGCGGTVSCGSTCIAADACHLAGTCSANVCSTPLAANGTPCSDGNACTTGDSCTNGVCAGNAVACASGDACHGPSACVPDAGTCSVETPVVCTALDECHNVGTCTVPNGCTNPPKGDGTPCSIGTCQGGTCTAPMGGTDAGDAGQSEAGPAPGLDGGGTPDAAGMGDAAGAADTGVATDAGGAGTPPGQSGGCGCRTVQARDGSPFGVAGIGILFLLAGARRRRFAARFGAS
jgi:MYXO-CTERM domain-containing protein